MNLAQLICAGVLASMALLASASEVHAKPADNRVL